MNNHPVHFIVREELLYKNILESPNYVGYIPRKGEKIQCNSDVYMTKQVVYNYTDSVLDFVIVLVEKY